MHIDEVWLDRLDRQASDLQAAEVALEDARCEGWRVTQAEVRRDAVLSAYHRLLDDAPTAVVAFHVKQLRGI